MVRAGDRLGPPVCIAFLEFYLGLSVGYLGRLSKVDKKYTFSLVLDKLLFFRFAGSIKIR